MKNKITIVILTYGRHKYLKRTINYYLEKNFTILVVDGTKKKLNHNISNKNLNYVHSYTHYYQRYILASKLLKTKYCILVNDDEFMFPSYIKKSIKILDENNLYSTVCGAVLTFNIIEEKIFFNHGYKNFSRDIANQTKMFDRIKFSIRNPSNYGYNAVRRSTSFNNVAKMLKKLSHPGNIFFVELLMNLSINSEGKAKYINELAWLRSFENKWVQTKNWNRRTLFQNPYLWLDKQNKKKISNLIKSFVGKIVVRKKNIKLTESMIIEELDNYTKFFKKKISKKNENNQTPSQFIKTISYIKK